MATIQEGVVTIQKGDTRGSGHHTRWGLCPPRSATIQEGGWSQYKEEVVIIHGGGGHPTC